MTSDRTFILGQITGFAKFRANSGLPVVEASEEDYKKKRMEYYKCSTFGRPTLFDARVHAGCVLVVLYNKKRWVHISEITQL